MGGGELPPPSPGPVEPDKSSLPMDLFSLHSVIWLVVTCTCMPFSWPRNNGWSTVCANSKLKETKPPIEIDVYMYYLQGSL